MTSRTSFSCLAAAVALISCSPGAQQSSPPPQQASAVIGTSGGTVALSNGVSVSVPSGALSSNTTVTVTETPSAPTPMNAQIVGTAYTFGPEGQQFAQPVTVTLPFNPQDLPPGVAPSSVVIFTAPVGSTSFTSLGGTLADATHVQAQTTHFSVFEPGVATAASDGGSNPSPSDGGCSVCANGLCSDSCPSGTSMCNGGCANTQSDPSNCGSCGAACEDGQTCWQGSCVAGCGAKTHSGCASDPTGPNSGPSCCTGYTACGSTCVDLTSDDQNCGACGTACPGGQSCQSGACAPVCPNGGLCFGSVCVPSCPSGSAQCNGACADVQHDSQNCGSCGNACPSGEACYAGACVQTCGAKNESGCGGIPNGGDGTTQCCSGWTACGQTCADLQNDPQNCGACGNACSSGQVCTSGVCGPECPNGSICFQTVCVPSCPSGTAQCSGTCVNTLSDPGNCGSCGAACPQGEGCLEGACVAYCGDNTRGGPDGGGTAPPADGGALFSGDAGTSTDCPQPGTMCGDRCTNTQGDPSNCGACGHVCSSGAQCIESTCVSMGGGCASSADCPPNMVCQEGQCTTPVTGDGGLACPPRAQCNGACTNILADPMNCGGCGVVCPSGAFCSEGVCGGSPAPDGGALVSCTADTDCGPLGEVCVQGQCVPPAGADGGFACPGTMCEGMCTNLMFDPNNCGGCNKVCGAGMSCEQGICVSAAASDGGVNCPPQGTVCGGVCTVTLMDPRNCGACGNQCAPNASCQEGVCMTSTAGDGGSTCPGQVCNGACTNTMFDSLNCGACGNACGTGAVCRQGVCVTPMGSDGGAACPPPGAMCGTGCTNTLFDPMNCGACGVQCATGACSNGVCQAPSADGGAPTQCSADGTCPAGETCVGGFCKPAAVCDPPGAICNGVCTDVAFDPTNCGACGNVCQTGSCQQGVCGAPAGDGGSPPPMCTTSSDCPSGESCISGTCKPTGECNPPLAMCNGVCTDVVTNPSNCGACGATCPSGFYCQQGLCESPSADAGSPPPMCSTDSDCPRGESCFSGTCKPSGQCSPPAAMCNGVCTDVTTNPANCGGCGSMCPSGFYCQQGLCESPSADGGTPPPVCTSDGACPEGMTCNLANVCVPGGAADAGAPPMCTSNADCPTGAVCGSNGVCGPSDGPPPCGSDGTCPAGMSCDATGTCVPGGATDAGVAPPPMCTSNADCPTGAVCSSNGICGPSDGPPPCMTDTDCPRGASCTNGLCMPAGAADAGSPPTCSSNADCPTGTICDAAGVCTPAG